MTTANSPGDSLAASDPWKAPIDALASALAIELLGSADPERVDAIRQQLDVSGGSGWDAALPLHRYAGRAGRPAPELARELASRLPSVPGLEAPVAQGAYLNYRASPSWLVETTLNTVFARGDSYGHGPATMVSVCVEHTSANPVSPFHIGRVRNAIIGDTLSRVVRGSGAQVTTQYYVDDVGRQTAMMTWIWSKPYDDWPAPIREAVARPDDATSRTEKPDARLGRPYPAASAYLKENKVASEEVAQLSRRLEAGEIPGEHRKIAEAILSGMLASLARIGIQFDEFVWESDFLRDASVQKVVERLAHAPHAVRDPNGALVIDASSYGLPTENARIVVTRGDGTTLYLTRDVAYHLQKLDRFRRVVDVLGQDHVLHARSLEALLEEIGDPRRPEFVLYQYITVEGQKMSTRLGRVVTLDELVDEAVERARKEILERRTDLSPEEVDGVAARVAAAAIRYLIVRVAPDKAVEFRWAEALSFEGRSGPFLQYAYARASSLLRKAERTQESFPFDAAQLHEPDEHALVKALSRLPQVVAYVARTSHVHTLATYAHDLADQFNRCYQNIPVLKAGSERESRVALVGATRQVLGNTLDLLGIARLERM